MRCLRATAALMAALWLAACGPAATPAPAPASAAAAAPVAPAREVRPGRDIKGRDLDLDERAGGHTLARHVGRTDQQLRDRLRNEPNISAASTYTDRATAERVVAQALDEAQSKVEQWERRRGNKPNLTLNVHVDDEAPIGRSLSRRGKAAVPCHDALVVLRARSDGFYVLTSYPETRR